VNFLEKLVNDPECGPRTGSPLARAALGAGSLFFAFHTFITDSIRLRKTGDGIYIHFADHPKTFIATIVGAAVVGVWGLTNARRRYRMHGE